MMKWAKRLLVGRPLRSERLGETLLPKKLALPWAERNIPVPLTELDDPYRDITGPVLQFVAESRRHPRDLVVIYIPEYVVGHWWEQLLHNQSALRLKARLLFQRGVMVTNVPWQLTSSHADERQPVLPPEPPPAASAELGSGHAPVVAAGSRITEA